MNYELAKQLKDIGFPQGGDGKWIGSPDALVWRNDDRAYVPTLEELIEACGHDFSTLVLEAANDERNLWRATGTGYSEYQTYPSPTEAVARLWLALYAKPGGPTTI
jgi:hypothetical protein